MLRLHLQIIQFVFNYYLYFFSIPLEKKSRFQIPSDYKSLKIILLFKIETNVKKI
jgi:hypothetical protein